MAEGLTDIEIAEFADRLHDLRARLQAESDASASARDTVTLDQQSVGRLSRMDAIQQQAMAKAEQRRRLHDITRIDGAFARIEAGEYGWCDACGEAIAKKRLETDPMANRCVGCAA